MNEKVLVLGVRGMLGTDLGEVFSQAGEVIGLDREEVDVTNRIQLQQAVLGIRPSIIINATGYTDVDGAEGAREAAFILNDTAVGYMVEAAQSVGAKLVHISTEYVFSGEKSDGYQEDVPTSPRNVYGESKAAGEKHIVAYDRGYLVRTSWLYGKTPQRGKPRGMNFVNAILAKARAGEELRVVNDQFGKLTNTHDLARAIQGIVHGAYAPGIYHLVNEGVASWYEVACEIVRLAGIEIAVQSVSSTEYPTRAVRPKHGVLLNTKAPLQRPWQQALLEYLGNV